MFFLWPWTLWCALLLYSWAGTKYRLQRKTVSRLSMLYFFPQEKYSVSWVENGRTSPSLLHKQSITQGLVHPCDTWKIQTYILHRLTSLLMALFCLNCFVLWKYVNTVWLERRWLWACEVEVEDLAMMNVCTKWCMSKESLRVAHCWTANRWTDSDATGMWTWVFHS